MSYRLFPFVLGALLLLTVGGARRAVPLNAQSDPTFASDATYAYGEGLHFTLAWESAVSVSTVTLLMQPDGDARPYSVAARLAPGLTVARQTISPTAIDLLPFQTLSYWWQITTASGDSYTVPAQTLTYADNRYAWQTATDGRFHVHWTRQSAHIGEVALATLAQSAARVDGLFGAGTLGDMHLYVYPSSADLVAMLRLQQANWQERLADGHVDPALGVMLVTAVNERTAPSDLARAIPDEAARHALYRLSGAPVASLPLWLRQGVAVRAAAAEPEQTQALQTAVANDQLLPLTALCTPETAAAYDPALVAAQSDAFVQYLHTVLGADGMRQLVRAAGADSECGETALATVTGQTLASWEQAWLATFQPPQNWERLLQENGFWLLLLLGGTFLATGLMIK